MSIQVIGNKLNTVKKRFVLWTSLLLVASIATAGSFHLPVTPTWSDAGSAKELGISVEQYKKLRTIACQLGSDVYKHRTINKDDIQSLFKFAEPGGKQATHVMTNFTMLRGTTFEPKATEIALRSSRSSDEHEAFTAINLLKYFGHPRWKPIAKAYPWKYSEYRRTVLD
jgi:hypothetical protein